jgi:predicted PurR-regulated permease PerM
MSDPMSDPTKPSSSLATQVRGKLGGPKRTPAFETVLLAGGFVLLLVLLYEMQTWLNPPVLAAAGVLLLWPVRDTAAVRAIFLSGGLLLALWFFAELSNVLIPFVLAYLLAYLFNPAVSWAERRLKLPRWASALAVTFLALGVVALVLLALIPSIIGQVEALGERLLSSVADLREWLATTQLLDDLEARGLLDKDDLLAQISVAIQEQTQAITQGIPETARGIVGQIGTFLAVFTVVSMVPVLLFYTLKDYPKITQSIIELFPTRGGRRDYLSQASAIVGSYLRGLMTISAIAGFNVGLALYLLDVPFALLLGLLAGLLNMVPTIGATITAVIGVFVAAIFGDPWYMDVVWVLVVLLGQGLLEQSVLSPNILSYQVGVHPVLILLSLFAFGYFLGFFGLLIAVPLTAVLITAYRASKDAWTLDLEQAYRADGSSALLQRLRRATSAQSADLPEPAEEAVVERVATGADAKGGKAKDAANGAGGGAANEGGARP